MLPGQGKNSIYLKLVLKNALLIAALCNTIICQCKNICTPADAIIINFFTLFYTGQ